MNVVPKNAKLLGGDGLIAKGKKLKPVDIPLDYEIGFTLAVSAIASLKGWRNILHFSATGKNCCNYGDRIPGVWFQPNTLTLYIVDGHTQEGNSDTLKMKCDLKPLTLQRGRAYRVKMVFKQKSVSIWVNGKVACSNIPRKDRKVFKNVQVYASDPWYAAADVAINGLYLKAGKSGGGGSTGGGGSGGGGSGGMLLHCFDVGGMLWG